MEVKHVNKINHSVCIHIRIIELDLITLELIYCFTVIFHRRPIQHLYVPFLKAFCC